MISEEGDDVVARYRAAARETPAPSMDAAILLAASRALRSRRSRRTWFTAAAAAVAAVVIALGTLMPRADESAPGYADPARSFGRLEGRSRPFLLRESGVTSVGPGNANFIQVSPEIEENTDE